MGAGCYEFYPFYLFLTEYVISLRYDKLLSAFFDGSTRYIDRRNSAYESFIGLVSWQ
jgi:hypothetical protein